MATTITHPAKVTIHHPATFGCSTDIKRPYRWHWMKNGKVIGGSHNAASYQTPPVQESDFGNKYSVTVWGVDGTVETSKEITFAMPIPIKEVEAKKEEVEPAADAPQETQKEEETT